MEVSLLSKLNDLFLICIYNVRSSDLKRPLGHYKDLADSKVAIDYNVYSVCN